MEWSPGGIARGLTASRPIKAAAHVARRSPGVVAGAAREGLGELRDGLTLARDAVRHLPEAWPTWRRLWHALVSGERTVLPGRMPPYEAPDAQALAAARRRGDGRTLPQGFLGGPAGADPTDTDEPVTLVVRGSRAQLAAALRSQGWVEAAGRTPLAYLGQALSVVTRWSPFPQGPVSEMYLDGQLPVLAFSKHSDYNLARDHLRVFALGPDPVTGEARWAIAATRDTGATVRLRPRQLEFGHQIDPDLDRERDLVMHDLLASGRVATWAAVPGVRGQGAQQRPAPDGRLQVNQYVTDGRVYDVALAMPTKRPDVA